MTKNSKPDRPQKVYRMYVEEWHGFVSHLLLKR